MAKPLSATPQVSGPLNTAHIESVTHQDHDHKILWDTTNNHLGSHDTQIKSLQAQLATLQAKLDALK